MATSAPTGPEEVSFDWKFSPVLRYSVTPYPPRGIYSVVAHTKIRNFALFNVRRPLSQTFSAYDRYTNSVGSMATA